MRRVAEHFLLSVFVLPWAASSLWFWLHGIIKTGSFNLPTAMGAIPYAMAYGLLGMIICLTATVPYSIATAVLMARAPKLAANLAFRVFIIGSSSIVGLALALMANRLLNTGRSEYMLWVIGALTGGAIAARSLQLWRGMSTGYDP
jgi:hypothetical protein